MKANIYGWMARRRRRSRPAPSRPRRVVASCPTCPWARQWGGGGRRRHSTLPPTTLHKRSTAQLRRKPAGRKDGGLPASPPWTHRSPWRPQSPSLLERLASKSPWRALRQKASRETPAATRGAARQGSAAIPPHLATGGAPGVTGCDPLPPVASGEGLPPLGVGAAGPLTPAPRPP